MLGSFFCAGVYSCFEVRFVCSIGEGLFVGLTLRIAALCMLVGFLLLWVFGVGYLPFCAVFDFRV